LVSQCSGHPFRNNKGINANACNGAACFHRIKDIGTAAATTAQVTARDAAATAHATATTGCSSPGSTATAIAATEGATAATASASN